MQSEVSSYHVRTGVEWAFRLRRCLAAPIEAFSSQLHASFLLYPFGAGGYHLLQMFSSFKLAYLSSSIAKALKYSEFYNTYKDTFKGEIPFPDIENPERWIVLCRDFVEKIWKKGEAPSLFDSYGRYYHSLILDAGLTKDDLLEAIIWMTISIMPNPVMKTHTLKKSYAFVPTNIFIERERQLKPFLYLCKNISSYEEPLKSASWKIATFTKAAHDRQWGAITLEEI